MEWRSAGTGLCSYRVRGVDGSCAAHLTVESYRYSITHLAYSFIPGLKPSFSANPSHCSLSFSSSGFTTCIPHTVYCYFSAYPFLLFSFSVLVCFTLLVVGSVRQITPTHVSFRAHVKIASRIVSYRMRAWLCVGVLILCLLMLVSIALQMTRS